MDSTPSQVSIRSKLRAVSRSITRTVFQKLIRAARPAIPLPIRKTLVRRSYGLGPAIHHVILTELLADLRHDDPSAFHRFLWSNHLDYARTYEVDQRYGEINIAASRRVLLAELVRILRERGLNAAVDVHSVFDVGCSLGHLLRFAETDVFLAATKLEGLDIDSSAVEKGNGYLRSARSRVRVHAGDVMESPQVMCGQSYDVVLCCGVLMYVDEGQACEVIKTMLQHTRLLAGIITLAHPTLPNSQLERPAVRESDGSFIHNLDRLVQVAGGRVLSRWRVDEYSPAYGVIVEPPNSLATEGEQ